jgi:DNA repair exonuclease SbcCD nuclease subunit
MPYRPFRILCTGDVHLGRRPSRVPVEDDTLSVSRVWGQFIDTAVDRAVDAVALTGDIVESENSMYEAFGDLKRGIQRLLSADVHVVAVAGNHDYDAFPRLVGSIDDERFHLLGGEGRWESVQIEEDEAPPVQFVGWSFPEATVTSSPLDEFDLEERDGATIGLLHCEAGRAESRYAPVGRDALARQPVDAWLLGHIHAPKEHWEEDQLQLYPGSLQPLDPGERGEHGAWLVEVDSTGSVDTQMMSIASLRYDTVSVDVTGLETAESVESAVFDTIRDGLTVSLEKWPQLSHVAYRLVYEGRTHLHQALENQARGMVRDLQVPVDEATATIEDFRLETRPDYDLEALAEGDDPSGVLARLILELESDGTESDAVTELLRRTDKALGSVHESSGYEPLRRDSETQEAPTREKLRTVVRSQSYRLLDEIHDRR